MASSPVADRSGVARALAVAGACAVAAACVVAVAAFGELSPGSLVAVVVTGALVVGLGLARRAGAGAPPAGRPGPALLTAVGLVGLWELAALAGDGLPTLSDLADPVLALPLARAAATALWLAAGAWLAVRPRGPVAAAMRRAPGRAAVFAAWLWLGVHFLAR